MIAPGRGASRLALALSLSWVGALPGASPPQPFAPQDAPPPLLVLTIGGDVNVALSDPKGRCDQIRGTSEIHAIPGCVRSAWNEPDTSDVANHPTSTVFEITDPAPGRWIVQAQRRSRTLASLSATATLPRGGACAGFANARLIGSARVTWALEYRPRAALDSCVIQIETRRGARRRAGE